MRLKYVSLLTALRLFKLTNYYNDMKTKEKIDEILERVKRLEEKQILEIQGPLYPHYPYPYWCPLPYYTDDNLPAYFIH